MQSLSFVENNLPYVGTAINICAELSCALRAAHVARVVCAVHFETSDVYALSFRWTNLPCKIDFVLTWCRDTNSIYSFAAWTSVSNELHKTFPKLCV